MASSRMNAPAPAVDGLPRRVAREAKVHTQGFLAGRRARQAARGSTVIVGPWSSEVGFELLYWVPFVRGLLRRQNVSPDRVIVVSRGGVADWYGELTTRYVDLLDWHTPERLLEEHQHRIRVIGAEKQLRLTPFEREVLARVRAESGDPDARVLHPSAMYRRYRAVWMRRRAPAVVEREVEFEPIAAAGTPPGELGKGEYIAVKAYFSSTFPATSENRAALHGLVERLAKHAPVVLLGSGGMDDHEHPALQGIDVVAADGMAPRTNLGEQTGIVSGARLLVATYGGFSYLGPFMGVPTCAFYSHDVSNPVHLELLRAAERKLASPGYLAFDIHHLPLIDRLARDPATARP